MSNNKIAIIAAMEEEIEAISKLMENKKKADIYELEFTEGIINNKECILVKCGVGKVNAARVTQILIDKYLPKAVVNVGTAGSVNDKLEIGDIVVGKEIVQHDFDITAFGHEKGYITDIGKIFYSDEDLIQKVEDVAKSIQSENNFKIIKGVIATGDIFCTSPKMKEKIREKFNADCVEMEGCAIAQVCALSKTPFIIIRAISDKPNGENQIDFDKFLEFATKRYAKLIRKLLND